MELHFGETMCTLLTLLCEFNWHLTDQWFIAGFFDVSSKCVLWRKFPRRLYILHSHKSTLAFAHRNNILLYQTYGMLNETFDDPRFIIIVDLCELMKGRWFFPSLNFHDRPGFICFPPSLLARLCKHVKNHNYKNYPAPLSLFQFSVGFLPL